MLFDLKGKRRRVVQGVYLMLAVVLGGGLVLFGIGGDAPGGLLDAFRGEGGEDISARAKDLRDEAKDADKRAASNPRDAALRAAVAKAWYDAARSQADPDTGVFGEEAKNDLEKADEAWRTYISLEPKRIDVDVAERMTRAYGPTGLNKPDEAATVAELVTEAEPTTENYLRLTAAASAAGQTQKAENAGRKAIDTAPKAERKQVKEAVEAAKAQAEAGGAGGAGGGPAPVPGG